MGFLKKNLRRRITLSTRLRKRRRNPAKESKVKGRPEKRRSFFLMLTISKLKKRVESMDIRQVITDALEETTGDFEQKNREQMLAGKTKDGKAIAPKYRSSKYASAKNAMNPAPGLGTPDLKLTGEFHRLLDVEVGKVNFDIVSLDDKGPELEDKYPAIFGLGGEFKKAYLEGSLRPLLKEKIEGKTGLKFNETGEMRRLS